MKYHATSILAFALLASALPAAAGPMPMSPMRPGFHQLLKCNHGYVTIDVAAGDAHIAPQATLVTTAVAMGQSLTKTQAMRSIDGQGNTYAYGYVVNGAVKRFPKQLLLPANPPSPGERSTYFNITGVTIEKRFAGTKTTTDASGHAVTGYVFEDYLTGHKLNSVVYVPAIGVVDLRFYAVAGPSGDLVCHVARG